MGNSRSHHRNQIPHGQPQQPHLQHAQNEATGNRDAASAVPYPSQYPNANPNSQYYPGHYPMPPVPVPHGHHHGGSAFPNQSGTNWVDGLYPHGSNASAVTYLENQKVVTIHNDVNINKESLRVEPDKENPGQVLVAFTFDATAAGSITVFFFAKEGADCDLMAMKECLHEPVTVSFQCGLGQKFRQSCGTGIDFSMFKETQLAKEGDMEAYPLAVKADTYQLNEGRSEGNPPGNSQITLAVFEKKEKDEYHVRVKKQILWVDGIRYELQEIYGIGNSVDGDFDGNGTGKECVICLSEPRDTTVLPCRHMCMCNGCAKALMLQKNHCMCPICRQPVQQLMKIEMNSEHSV